MPAVSRSPSPATYWVLEAELEPGAEELWSWYCFQSGANGAEWLEESPARLRIAYFFDQLDPHGAEAWRAGFCRALPGAQAPARIAIAERPRQAWDTAWHAHFTPVPVGHGLVVCPPWDAAPSDLHGARRVLLIEPGQGFGTGRHASTMLALELIEDELRAGAPPEWIVDIGTGSGILAIAARLLGVPRAVAVDIDRAAVNEVAHNFRLNGLAPPWLMQGGANGLRGSFPLVVANLVMPLLDIVAADLAGLTAPGGSLILSGVLEGEHKMLLRAYAEQGFRMADSRTREGWIATRLRRDA